MELYRKFIGNRIRQMQDVSNVSARTLNKDCGFESANYLKFVVEGKRNLSPEGLARVIHGLALTSQESVELIGLYQYAVEDAVIKELGELQKARARKRANNQKA